RAHIFSLHLAVQRQQLDNLLALRPSSRPLVRRALERYEIGSVSLRVRHCKLNHVDGFMVRRGHDFILALQSVERPKAALSKIDTVLLDLREDYLLYLGWRTWVTKESVDGCA